MKRLLPILFLLLSASLPAQELTVQGRLVDAETGEPLPYATVYKGEGRGALTNVEGDFRLYASAQDLLTFSFVGYDKLQLKAWEVPRLVRLKPLERALKEVVVKPVDEWNVVGQVIGKLKKDFSKHRDRREDRSAYFLRTLLKNKRDSYLRETIMSWCSAVNLRDEETYTGRYGMNDQGSRSNIHLRFTNINRVAEISPSAFMSQYWKEAIKPLNSLSMTKKYYDIELETLFGGEEEKLYRITFRWNGKSSGKQDSRRYLTGAAYVDAGTLRLLRFQGEVGNAYQSVDNKRMPTSIKFNVNYDYAKGYTTVGNLAVQGGNDAMNYKLILYDVHDDSLAMNGGLVGENVQIYAKFDSTKWEKYNIVKRTSEEELLAFGENLTSSPPNPSDSASLEEEEYDLPEEGKEEESLTIEGEAWRESPFLERLVAFGKTIPQEKVYVHMDNTSYFQGDTIWFSAYTRQTNTDKPSDVSGLLYVELLNDDGYLVERKLIEMKAGRGNGFFALNKMIQYSGFYELRAYTRWQLNWGEHEHKHPRDFGLMFRDKETEREFFRDYDKLYSRVFPVYDKPQTPGDETRDMTLRVLRREFKNDPEKRKLQLSLFPEGGNLVAGVENRVAFEAAMSDGEQVEGVLSVGNERVETVNRGRGMFTIVPEKGVEREVTFVAANGEKVSAKLPKPEEEGVAIRVMQEGDSIIIGTSLAGLSADSLALTVMHEGKVEKFHKLNSQFTIHNSQLKSGIHQATVFDTQGRVLADRLFFVTKPEQMEPTLMVSGQKDKYEPYEAISLTIKRNLAPTLSNEKVSRFKHVHRLWAERGAGFSLSVRDGNHADPLFDDGNIMTEMLLSSEIKGFIPNPGWYFEKDDEAHRQALDLLMMTQGWRRFVWRDMAVRGEWDITQPGEKTPILMGRVSFNPNRISALPDYLELSTQNSRDYKHILELAKKKLTPSMRVHAELVSLDSTKWAVSEEPFKGDNFKLLCPKIYGNSMLFLAVADTAKWAKKKHKQRYSWIQTAGYGEEFPLRIQRKLYLGEADFRTFISWPCPRFVKPYGFYQSHLPSKSLAADYDVPSELLADSSKMLREVPVKARRKSRLKGFDSTNPAFMVDACEAWNTIEDAGIPLFDFGNIGKTMVRVYMNDYGVNEEKDGNHDSRIRIYPGLSPTRRALPQYVNIPVDSLYHPKYLTLFANDTADISPGERREFMGDERINEDPRCKIDRYVVYSDYQPRLEGSDRYKGANRPETRIVVYPFYDGRKRAVYRDRHYLLPGFSVPADFYSPDYSQQKPPEPTDYRRTLYWNPNLQLDKNGEARITFYNNSRQTRLSIEAEGQAANGTLLWSK